ERVETAIEERLHLLLRFLDERATRRALARSPRAHVASGLQALLVATRRNTEHDLLDDSIGQRIATPQLVDQRQRHLAAVLSAHTRTLDHDVASAKRERRHRC